MLLIVLLSIQTFLQQYYSYLNMNNSVGMVERKYHAKMKPKLILEYFYFR